jgi:hypothetical protein
LRPSIAGVPENQRRAHGIRVLTLLQQPHVAALEGGVGQDLADGRAEAGMIVGDDELDAVEAAFAQADEEVLPR